MKALKIALLALGLFWLNNLKADTYNFGVSATANIGGSGIRNGSQLLGLDQNTNTIRMLNCTTNGGLALGSYVSLSTPTVSLIAPYSQNITVAAGTTGTCYFCFGSFGPNAGLYYGYGTSQWVPPVWYYAVSTTPICLRNLGAGTVLYLSPTASALTVTVGVNYGILQ